MPRNDEFDLFIVCGACGVDNFISAYTPQAHSICNQCRERLVVDGLRESHHQYVCDQCGTHILLKKDTPFVIGEAACQCGSTSISRQDEVTVTSNWESMEKDDITPKKAPDDFDWCRTEPATNQDDYNDLFDKDIGVG